MCSGEGDWTCLQPGFPIRKSSDHSLVIDSPRLIADSYVLLRFLVPRHPPCALKNLATFKDARVHCVVLKVRAALTDDGACRSRGGSSNGEVLTGYPIQKGAACPSLQDPTTCQALAPCRLLSTVRRRIDGPVLAADPVSAPNNRCSTLEHLS